jgi:hypothetical protein
MLVPTTSNVISLGDLKHKAPLLTYLRMIFCQNQSPKHKCRLEKIQSLSQPSEFAVGVSEIVHGVS